MVEPELYLYTDVDLYLLRIEIALLNSGTCKLFSTWSKDNFYSAQSDPTIPLQTQHNTEPVSVYKTYLVGEREKPVSPVYVQKVEYVLYSRPAYYTRNADWHREMTVQSVNTLPTNLNTTPNPESTKAALQ